MKKHAVRRSSRCHYHSSSGRRCRLSVVRAGSEFCRLHARLAESPEPDLSAALTGGLEKFDSVPAINDFLCRLLLLLSQDRISARRAAVLAFITSQILRTITLIEAAKEEEPVEIEYVMNIPGLNDEPAPSPTP